MDMTVNDAVANRVIKLLQERKITQYRLEQNSGIPHGSMDRILCGQNKTVTFTTVYKLANGFGMSLFEFLDDEVFRSENLETE